MCNEDGNVVGLMPHPERASSELLGSTDGLVLLRALLAWTGARRTGAGELAPHKRLTGREGAPAGLP